MISSFGSQELKSVGTVKAVHRPPACEVTTTIEAPSRAQLLGFSGDRLSQRRHAQADDVGGNRPRQRPCRHDANDADTKPPTVTWWTGLMFCQSTGRPVSRR